MTEKEQYSQKEPDHKWRTRDGFTPSYRALHEVYITKDLGSERNEELIAFIGKHIAESFNKVVLSYFRRSGKRRKKPFLVRPLSI